MSTQPTSPRSNADVVNPTSVNEPIAPPTGNMSGTEVQKLEPSRKPPHVPKDTTVLDRMRACFRGKSLANHKVTLSSKKWFRISAGSVVVGMGCITAGVFTIATGGIGGIIVGGLLVIGGGCAAYKGKKTRKAEQAAEMELLKKTNYALYLCRLADHVDDREAFFEKENPERKRREETLKSSLTGEATSKFKSGPPLEALWELSRWVTFHDWACGPGRRGPTNAAGFLNLVTSHVQAPGSGGLPDLKDVRAVCVLTFLYAISCDEDTETKEEVPELWRICTNFLRATFAEMDERYGKTPPSIVAPRESESAVDQYDRAETPDWLSWLEGELPRDVRLPEFRACVRAFEDLAERYNDNDVATLRPNDRELDNLLNKTIACAKRGVADADTFDENAGPTYADLRLAVVFAYVHAFYSKRVEGKACNAVLRALFDKLDERYPLQDISDNTATEAGAVADN